MAKGLVLQPHVVQDPPVTATDKQCRAKQEEIRGWLRDAGMDEQADKNWYGNGKAFLELTPDPKNEKPSILQVGKLNLPHGEGPTKHGQWWRAGGTLGDVGDVPTPPPSEYAEEPPVTFPPYQVAYDIFSRYPEGSVWVKLGPNQLQQAIARTSYGIVWSGQRAANLDERVVRAAQDAEPGILPDMWFTGWMTGAQGFDVVDGMIPGSELRKAYIGVTAESYLKQQLEAGAGSGPSGA